MKRTGKANKAAAPPVPLGLRGKSRYTFREIDEWLRSLGAKPMSRKTEARLRKPASWAWPTNAEVRQLRRTARRIAASKSAARRLLAATGMYTLKGELKPQFR